MSTFCAVVAPLIELALVIYDYGDPTLEQASLNRKLFTLVSHHLLTRAG